MKIKTIKADIDEAMAHLRTERKRPKKPNLFFRTLVRMAAIPDLKQTNFRFTKENMDAAGQGPWMILMNHSSFIDLEIVSRLMYPKPYCIVCTSDGFVGKEWLMRELGCIPTEKFVTDLAMIGDIKYALTKLSASVLMYPEASYSFDGRATALPRRLGVLFKRLGVPIVMVTTKGAFARDPLYNGLQKRKVNVSAEMRCLLSADDLNQKSVAEIDEILDGAFSFDNFDWQRKNKIEINEPFRADGLNRILYKCASCGVEGQMEGKGEYLVCHACGKKYHLTTLGELHAESGETEFSHIPDWYQWERDEVRRELKNGSYSLDVGVDVGVLTDFTAIRMVGEGRLTHTTDGFTLNACDGRLDYHQSPTSSYGLYSDYYWYEIGDMICIGNKKVLYYCFPHSGDIVAKTRIAAEELYKLKKQSSTEE